MKKISINMNNKNSSNRFRKLQENNPRSMYKYNRLDNKRNDSIT
jgi:hypothetical protein